MVSPARAWEYLSACGKEIFDKPKYEAMTQASIVVIVTSPKTIATATTANTLDLAAGYIMRGISGSQGPKTKMTKRTQGVTLAVSVAAWTWE